MDKAAGKELFETMPVHKAVEFLLGETEKIGDGGLRLNYQVKNRKA
ncbi:MAG: hypothetical protein K2O16_14165 [Lachnospiraceae bacterium]|nr:hypothetical protein [Lachnospiraceae bacterium]